jgi:NAD(P)-dependent dehydrogenase (short-subunit alcohol dehydrogenase family)
MPSSVFITGTDHGLGRALVDRFLTEGWSVFAGRLELCTAGAAARGERGLVEVPLDVRDLTSVRDAARAVGERTPSLDFLVNNAGVHPSRETRVEDVDFEAARDVLDVNALGPLRVTQQFLALLERGARKVIVNVSSEAGSLATCTRGGEFAYCMSKAALNMQTRLLQNGLGSRGFRVFSVHPGWMRTPMSVPEAPLDPAQSAARIYALFADPGSDLPRFVAHDGSEHAW